MKPRSVMVFLAGLGAVLLLAIVRVKVAAPLPDRVAPQEPTDARDARVPPDPAVEGPPLGIRAKLPRLPFRWSQVESSDYRQYIANLRATGCPEPTLQDIIVADVNKLYEPREMPFKAQLAGFNLRQWNDPSTDPGYTKQEFAARKQLREVEQEKQAVIKELL